MAIPSFNDNQLKKLSEVVVEACTHRELSELLKQCGIAEQGGGPRWQRTLLALKHRQEIDTCGSNVGAFIQAAMEPVRFVGNLQRYEELRAELNKVLAFSGITLGEDGKLRAASPARTLTEAEERAGRLRNELTRRKVHPDVLKFCRAELLQDNCFHAVLEATKSVAQKIRDKTGLGSDGGELVQEAFAVRNPLLAINSLQTDTEKSEQSGFANLMIGMFGTFRNVTAHAPKIHWKIEEQDALDLLSLVSYLHRRLDNAFKVPRVP
jgi:uncharacterized protein (TIGR02391 family)